MNLNLAGNNALKQPQTAMCSQVNKDASEAVALLVLTSLSKKEKNKRTFLWLNSPICLAWRPFQLVWQLFPVCDVVRYMKSTLARVTITLSEVVSPLSIKKDDLLFTSASNSTEY